MTAKQQIRQTICVFSAWLILAWVGLPFNVSAFAQPNTARTAPCAMTGDATCCCGHKSLVRAALAASPCACAIQPATPQPARLPDTVVSAGAFDVAALATTQKAELFPPLRAGPAQPMPARPFCLRASLPRAPDTGRAPPA